jgi:hypothetical protein
MNIKATPANKKKLEQIFEDLGYAVRYEKGHFQSGYCIVEHRKVVVVNRFFDLEGRVNVMLEILKNIEVEVASLSEDSRLFYRKIFPEGGVQLSLDEIA